MDVIHIVYIYIFQLFINVQTYLANFAPFLCFFYIRVIIISCVYKNMYTGGSNDRFDRT